MVKIRVYCKHSWTHEELEFIFIMYEPSRMDKIVKKEENEINF